jgi:hypothetical protein
MSTLHIIPISDEVGHDESEDCICGPDQEFVEGPEGTGWLVIHHSLDGREQHD